MYLHISQHIKGKFVSGVERNVNVVNDLLLMKLYLFSFLVPRFKTQYLHNKLNHLAVSNNFIWLYPV